MTGANTDITVRLTGAHDTSIDWEREYLTHAPALLRYLRRLAKDPTDAEDMLQETFERAARAVRTPSGTELRPWLYRISTNLAVDRARRHRLLAFIPFTGRELDDRPAFDSKGDAVRRALRAIPPDEAATLVLRLHEGFSRSEIAQLMNVSERKVKDRLERGRENFAVAYRQEESLP